MYERLHVYIYVSIIFTIRQNVFLKPKIYYMFLKKYTSIKNKAVFLNISNKLTVIYRIAL